MPYTVSSAMSQGVPQIGGDEELAYRNRGLQMQQYLANAQINAMRAMNQDNLTGAQEGRLTDRETALMTGGSYADRSAARAAELQGGYGHETDMANLNNNANANLANIAGGYQLAGQKVAVGPAQTLADLQGREYGDRWNAGASDRDLNERLNRMITDRISGSGGGSPQGNPGEYGPAPVSQTDYQIGNGGGAAGGISPKLLEQIIRHRSGIPDDPLDAAVSTAIGTNIANSDDPAAALTTYRSTGKAPNPNLTGFDTKTASTVQQLSSQPLIASGLSELSDYAGRYANLMTADKREHIRQIIARLQSTAANLLRGDTKSMAMFGDTIKAVLAKAANDRGGGILGALRQIAPAFGQDEARQEFGY